VCARESRDLKSWRGEVLAPYGWQVAGTLQCR
jgi:hypothetical protein